MSFLAGEAAAIARCQPIGAYCSSPRFTVAREWERGTMEQLMSTPVTAREIMLGKLLPYFVIGLVDAALCVSLGVGWFGVPFRGTVGDAMALVEATEARGLAPFIHVERAALAHLLGDEATRQRALREAHRLFTEMGAPVRAEQVARQLGSNAEPTPGISSASRT